MSYMGIDIGTSGCKAAVFDENGQQISYSFREYNTIHPQAGWVELDSNEVIQCCFDIIRESARGLKDDPPAAMGISSQGEAFTLIDKHGKTLTNAFVSSDIRAEGYTGRWVSEFGSERLYNITGHTAHPMFSLFKLLWVKDHLPEIWAKTYKILCFEDLLQYRLGIERPLISWALAGRTMLFDVTNHCWSKEILSAVNILPGKLSTPSKSGTVCGTTNKRITEDLGLSSGLEVVTGGHDQPCSALGAGALTSGEAGYSSGTVECITPSFSKPIFSNDLLKNNLCVYDHVIPGLYATVAFSLTGGNLLKWFVREFGFEEFSMSEKSGIDPYSSLIRKIPEKISDIIALPYFTPSGTPYFDIKTKGAIIGLALTSEREEILKALIEGIAFELKLNLEILENAGHNINRLKAIGGGAASRNLIELKSNVINKPIEIMKIKEAGCFGGAMLALAGKKNKDLKSIADQWINPGDIIYPKNNEAYSNKFSAYKQMYALVKRFYSGNKSDSK